MFAWAAMSGASLRIGRARPSPRRPVRSPAILPQLQLRLCRRASRHQRPGRDRLRASDGSQQRPGLAVPQAEIDLGASSPARRSPASASPCCSSRRCARARPPPARCCSGSASPCSECSPLPSPTSCRRAGACAAWPLATLLAWGMVYGIVANALFALRRRRTAGDRGPARLLARPRLSRPVRLGSRLPALFRGDAGRRARARPPIRASSCPILAMVFSTMFEGYRWSTLAVAGGLRRPGRPGHRPEVESGCDLNPPPVVREEFPQVAPPPPRA